jgi:RNA polymerase sigma-70 factor, ECF subfamily
MEMSSAHSPDTRLSFGPRQTLAEVPCWVSGRINQRTPRRHNPGRTPVLPRFRGDWVVVRKAMAGNAAAQEQLFGCNRPKLYRIAFGILRNKEDAEDALQDGLCTAYSRLRSFQGRSAFSTWLTRIVINASLMARRKNRRRGQSFTDEVLIGESGNLPREMGDSRFNPERLYAAAEVSAVIEERLVRLHPNLQVPFRLNAINEIPGPHSSRMLGISPSALKSRVFRARGKLAAQLRPLLGHRGRTRSGRVVIWAE